MEFPSIIANREAYRRSLQTSLHDVLGDVSLDAQQINMAGRPMQPRSPIPPSSFDSSMLTRPGSLLSQSLGSPSSFSSFGFGRPEDLLLAKAAEDHLLSQAAKAAFLQQTIAAQQNKQAMQEAYIKILQKQLAVSKANQALPAANPLGLSNALALPSPEASSFEKKQKIAQTLKALGTNLRSRYDPFIDCIDIEDPEEEAARRSRGGVSEHFPERLHRMLIDVEKEGMSDIVSFFSHGRAFGVHDMDRFIAEIMPKYFKQAKFSSFARQLNLYGFMRLASGPDAGGYYHELFLQGRPTLCRYMRRVGVPSGQQDRRKCRPKNVVDIQEPDFYSMRPSKAEQSPAEPQKSPTPGGMP